MRSASSCKIHEAILTIKPLVKFTSHEKYKTACHYKTGGTITDKTTTSTDGARPNRERIVGNPSNFVV